MLKDKHTEFEISKLQKQIDRKKVTTVTTKVTNVTNPVQPETVLSKPIADDMTVDNGQTLVYNEENERWEPGGTVSDHGGLVGLTDDDHTQYSLADGSRGLVEGTNVLSTGEAGGTKFLREDGDGTCSWQEVAGGSGLSQQQIEGLI